MRLVIILLMSNTNHYNQKTSERARTSLSIYLINFCIALF